MMTDLKTSSSTANDFPLTYRRSEVEFIMRCVRAGDSCSVIGPSGVAKSNLCRFLRQESVRRHYLGEAWENYLLVRLDGNEVTAMTEQAVSALLVQRFWPLLLPATRNSKACLLRLKPCLRKTLAQ